MIPRKQMTRAAIFVVALCAGATLFFQNCTGITSSGPATDATATHPPTPHEQGGGDGYNGKIYVQMDITGTCLDGKPVRTQVLLQNGAYTLQRENCKDLVPGTAISPMQVGFGVDLIVVRGRLLQPQSTVVNGQIPVAVCHSKTAQFDVLTQINQKPDGTEWASASATNGTQNVYTASAFQVLFSGAFPNYAYAGANELGQPFSLSLTGDAAGNIVQSSLSFTYNLVGPANLTLTGQNTAATCFGALPEAPLVDANFTSVVLLEHFSTATAFRDSTGRHPDATPAGNPQIDAANGPFATGSVYLDGSSYLSWPNSADFNLSQGDSTIEMWIYPTNYNNCTSIYQQPPNCQESIISQSDSVADFNWWIGTNGGNNHLITFQPNGGGAPVSMASSGSMIGFAWNHLAITKQNGTNRIWINGHLAGQSTIQGYNLASKSLYLGMIDLDQGTDFMFHGYISELRITTGLARYTRDFSVPSAPFPDQ